MIMKNIKIGVIVSVILSLSMVSCSKYLEILPLNDVVLENYWTQEADVTAVLNSCYESLESTESILRMGLWGEVRSDNIVLGSYATNDINEILKENLLPTNTMVKWNIMYQTINRCNTVIHYAPGVQQLDPNYTLEEMHSNVAEATFIRDLCYFYLIRTFRNVPISFEPSIDDMTDYQIPATPMNRALDTLAADLEKVKDMAVRRYVDDSQMTNTKASSDAYENSSRVTRYAIYALLADINLWRQNYDETIKYCDLIIDFKKQQYKDKVAYLGDQNDMMEFAGIPLILEKTEGSTLCGNAYTEIFGTGNSFESIFELYFRNNQSVQNTYVGTYYGTSSTPLGRFASPDVHSEGAAEGTNTLFTKDDCRVYENMASQNNKYLITKYVNTSVTLDNSKVTDTKSVNLKTSKRGNSYSNWIIYRLTDVMLMKAEALIMKSDSEFESAFTLINAVNKRAHNYTTTSAKDTLVFDNYGQSRDNMEQLLLDERNRELMFEGKRWFDLVRVSLRDGNSSHLVREATVKYLDNINAIKIRLSDADIIFYPYFKDELDLNPYLVQNPAYSNTDDFD